MYNYISSLMTLTYVLYLETCSVKLQEKKYIRSNKDDNYVI